MNQETSASDAIFFTEYKNLTGLTHLPGQYVDSPLLSSKLTDYFKDVKRSQVEKLYEIYFHDFVNFNYSIDPFLEAAEP